MQDVFRASLALALAFLALPICSAGAQERSTVLQVPTLGACRSSAHPQLPQRWRAAYLMAPFTKAQLVLGEIESDAALGAMRVRLYGVQRGAADLFVQGERTYALAPDGAGRTACRDLGDTGWRPLARDWLTRASQCTGSAPVAGTAVDWWKTPAQPAPTSHRLWYDGPDRPPFRLAFQIPIDWLSILSQFALSYRVQFSPSTQTDLGAITEICKRAAPAPTDSGPEALRELIEEMPRSDARADAEIRRLMPSLAASCPTTPPPTWPDKLAFTGLMTPYDFPENPYPTEVLYDWSVPGQRTRVVMQPQTGVAVQDSLLLGPLGFTVTYPRRGTLMCNQVLPGTVRPDWASRGDCDCAATIEGTTPLSPNGTTRIFVCPLGAPRVTWAWYALDGRPSMFMVTSMRGDQGLGLFAILDYRDWMPGRDFPASVFRKPAQCRAGPGVAGGPERPADPPRCDACHLGSTSPP